MDPREGAVGRAVRTLPGAGLVVLLSCGPDEAARPEVDEAVLVEAFQALHEGVYGVYDQGLDRDAVHDRLAASFVGEQLTEQYVEHWRTLHAMAEEGTSIEVLGVEYDRVEVVESTTDGLPRIDAAWLVRGIVTHQRHQHPRINRYAAVYTLRPTDDGWRIVATRMRNLERVGSEVQEDDLFGDGAGGSATEAGFMDPLELFEAGLLGTETDLPPEAP